METNLSILLSESPVFSNLSPKELENLASAGIRKTYQSGEILVLAGDPWEYLFLVTKGKIKALKESPEGRSLVIAELEKGDLFWGLAFFEAGIGNPVTLQAIQPASVVLWNREKILKLLMENGRVTWELTKIMVKRMLQASEVIEGLAFQPVAGRLARLLVEFPGKASSGPTTRSLTLDEMAARIGSTREMVCRFLQRFADDGLIKITRTEFEVMDGGKLEEMAQKVKS
jgi:CRP/FNR family transcriptional regulator